MNSTVFFLTLQQFCVLFFFLIVGFLLNRFKVLKDSKPLSAVLMWVFLPAVVFNVFYKNFTLANFKVALPYALAGLIALLVFIGVSYLLVRRFKDRITRNTYWYSLIVTNMSYVGFPIMKSVFPEYELYFMVFIIAVQIFIFTVSVSMFKPLPEKVSLKGLLSPMIIALVLGIVCGLVFDSFSVKMPAPIENILDSAASCMSPIAMLITGFTLAKLPLSKVFSRLSVYVFTALRLIVYPVVFGAIAYLLHLALGFDIGIVKIIIIYSSLPMGINSVFFAEANGTDGTIAAQCAFISHAACIITMPFIFALVAIM